MKRKQRRQAGLSLLEILVAMSLGAFMLVGIISLMASVSATRTELNRNSEQIENGRYAIQILTDEIALAGYLGPYYNASISYTDPDPCETAVGSLGVSFTPGTDPVLPAAVSSYASTAVKPSCFTTTEASIRAGGEILVLRRVDVDSLASASAVNGVPYFQYSSCAGQSDFVFANTGSSAFTLSTKDSCGTAGSAPIWPYRVTSFFISSCDDCAGGDVIPTLKAVEFVSGARRTVSLVEGVEDMHFEYGIDLDNNGAPDCYVSDPRADDLSPGCPGTSPVGSVNDVDNLANVVSVQVSILVRSLTPFPGWTDDRRYDLGRGSLENPPNDGFKRKVFRTVIPIQNVSGARE